MTIIKFDIIDKCIYKISDVINKLGFKRTSGRLLDYILYRHNIPMHRINNIWMTKTYIKY